MTCVPSQFRDFERPEERLIVLFHSLGVESKLKKKKNISRYAARAV